MKLGIDYGTTTTQVSFCESETSSSKLVDIGGKQIGYMKSSIPSVISVGRSGDVAIGYEAEKITTENPNDNVLLRSLKRCLSCERKKEGAADNCWNKANLPFCVGNQQMKIFNKDFPVRKLVSQFIDKLLNSREVKPLYTGNNLDAVGISVPAMFGSEPRHTIYDLILEIVNKRENQILVDVINEPTAAILACQKSMLKDEDGVYAILDVGGGTSDILVYEKKNESYFLFKPLGLPVAGDDVDNELINKLFPRIKSQDERNRALIEVRRAKEQLTVSKVVRIADRQLSRSDFEIIIRPVIKKIVAALGNEIKKIFDVYKPYSQTGINFELRKIYLSGGGSKIPLLKQSIEQDENIVGYDPEVSFVRNEELYRMHGDDVPIFVVALGASSPKNKISEAIQFMLPYSIYVTRGAKKEEKLSIYTELPAEFDIRFNNNLNIKVLAIDPNNPDKIIHDLTDELCSHKSDEILMSDFLQKHSYFEAKIDKYNIMTITAANISCQPNRQFCLPWQGGIETASFEKYRKEWRRLHGYT